MRESTTTTTATAKTTRKLCVNNLAFYLSNTRRTNEKGNGQKEGEGGSWRRGLRGQHLVAHGNGPRAEDSTRR